MRSSYVLGSSSGHPVRVFVGLVEVAGFYSRLASGFRDAGADCTLCILADHQFGYTHANSVPRTLKYVRACVNKRARAAERQHHWRARGWRVMGLAARAILFAEVTLRHDVFVFGFGLTFFRGLDLYVLRFLGKKVVLVFNGSDHRPPYLNGVACRTSLDATARTLCDETARTKRRVTFLEANADLVIAHHLSAQFHERPFMPSTAIGLPCEISELEQSAPRLASNAVRIVHAPSNAAVKGTDEIRGAISRLIDRGYNISYEEIVGRPNAEVLTALRQCDFVVDEIYSDARMAGLASEAAMYGKPVIVAGYAADALMRIPGIVEVEDFPPVLYCRPEEIESAIEILVREPETRRALGERARAYVETNWRSEVVAERILGSILPRDRTIPLVDPQDLRYFHGFGLREDVLAEVLRAYVGAWGIDALHLSDKPALLSAVRQFCLSDS